MGTTDPTDPEKPSQGVRVLGMEPWGRGPCRAPTFIWLSIAMLLIGLALHIAAFSTSEWAKESKGKRTLGLWRSCDEDGVCWSINDSPPIELGDAGRAAQVFACFTLIGMIVSFVLLMMYIFRPKLRFLWILLMATRWATLFFLTLTLITWSVLIGVDDPSGFVLGTSFGMDVFCFIIELVGALTLLSLFRIDFH